LINQIASASHSPELEASLLPGQSAIGGGSGPNVHPATVLIALKHQTLSADNLEQKLRQFSPPVIARIADGLVLIDLRTIDTREEPDLLRALTALSKTSSAHQC
jgi:L-seryl-tRNA(Ser) seleniumtransferase